VNIHDRRYYTLELTDAEAHGFQGMISGFECKKSVHEYGSEEYPPVVTVIFIEFLVPVIVKELFNKSSHHTPAGEEYQEPENNICNAQNKYDFVRIHGIILLLIQTSFHMVT